MLPRPLLVLKAYFGMYQACNAFFTCVLYLPEVRVKDRYDLEMNYQIVVWSLVYDQGISILLVLVC